MCGITASIALPSAKANGHTNGVNGHTNGVNGHSNGVHTPTAATLKSQLQSSIDILNHRGPDESDIWLSPSSTTPFSGTPTVALGHCRLSINDLSPSGRQPLHNPTHEIHAVVNGEIYDHDRLRLECASQYNYAFSSHSDSELVIALYQIHGAPAFFEHLRGEFAFVLYDARPGQERVIMARDRFGIKPLVYTECEGRMLVASEAKAFLPLGWRPRWDVKAIVDGGWMVDERTLFRGVRKVLPGEWVEISGEGVKKQRYWDAEYPDKAKVETRTVEEMVQGVRERLVESIKLRMRADVPVGVYLSGGIDSSAVAGIVTELAQKDHVKIGNSQATRVACFSVRFPEESGYDESSIAERTAQHLGVEIIKKDVTEATLARDFADTAYHCEHHHFDLNCVAKFALSTLPRDHGVKVVLTGEGADEHFAGYPYFPSEFLREQDLSLPGSQLVVPEKIRASMQTAAADEMKAIFASIGATEQLVTPEGHPIPETGLAWRPKNTLFSPWVEQKTRTLNCSSTVLSSFPASVQQKMQHQWHPLHTAQYTWNKSSLSNVLLSCLGDRTEMAHSVEARTPYLDHHLTAYVNSLPPSVKLAYTPVASTEAIDAPTWKSSGYALQSLTAKWILREAVRPYITDELYRRKKHPFLAPTKWSRGGELCGMLHGLLTRERVEGLGFVEWAVVERALEAAFGEQGEAQGFRVCVYVAAWVVLAERFGVERAREEDW